MKPTAIIFDITGVLFKEHKLRLIRKIGLRRIARYITRHRTNPVHLCYRTLRAIQDREQEDPRENITPFIYKKRVMPRCMADWQRGSTSNAQLLQQLNEHLQELSREGYFISRHEEQFALHVLQIMLNIDHLVAISKPIRRTVAMVKKLRRRGTYKLFVLSNMGLEPFELLRKAYPKIFDLFDDLIISAEVQYIKPEPMIFTHLLEKHQLLASECVFIDDQEENIVAARQLGIQGILFDKPSRVRKRLKRLKVL